MRKLRNPRYAPEFLESKLSPSTMTPVMPTSVSIAPTTDPTMTIITVISTDPTSTTTSIDYPPPPPPPPAGPTVPAVQ